MTFKTFDQLIDFTRTSAATYVNSTGQIATTAASVNLLTYTQEFDNAAWTKVTTSVIPNQDPGSATIGSELITNGDFTSGTGWTLNTGFSVTGGQLVATTVATAETATATTGTIYPGKLYVCTFTIASISAGGASLNVGGVSGTSRTTTGTFTEYIVATSSASAAIQARGGTSLTAAIDNVTVREVVGGFITAPDGTYTADKLYATTSAGRIYQNVTAAGPCTFSFYAKAGEMTAVNIRAPGNSVVAIAYLDLTTGVISGVNGTYGTASVVSAGNGWYRFIFNLTASITNISFAPCDAVGSTSSTPSGTNGIFIWGTQIELGSTATTYTRNYGGLYPARFDYDPVTLAPKGLLVEEQRTNLLLYSEQFDNAAWNKLNATVTANATTSPDGTVDADKLVETTATAQHFTWQSLVKATSAIAYASTVYLRAAERTRTRLLLHDGSGNGVSADVNLSAGTIGAATNNGTGWTSLSASIANAGNGWYRCTVAGTSNTAASLEFRITLLDAVGASSYTGDGTSGIYLWGAQLEAGAFATSYIRTAASQVTRSADIPTITGVNFSSCYNTAAGTFVVEGDAYSVAAGSTLLNACDNGSGGSIERMQLRTNASAGQLINSTGGVAVASATSGTLTNNTIFKIAGAFKTDNFAISTNGASPGIDTAGAIALPVELRLGRLGPSEYLNGHIRSIKYYPSRLPNAQLQALTS